MITQSFPTKLFATPTPRFVISSIDTIISSWYSKGKSTKRLGFLWLVFLSMSLTPLLQLLRATALGCCWKKRRKATETKDVNMIKRTTKLLAIIRKLQRQEGGGRRMVVFSNLQDLFGLLST